MTSVKKLLSKLDLSLSQDTFVRLTLSKCRDEGSDLKKVLVKYVYIKDKPALSFTLRHTRKDITKNYSFDDGIEQIDNFLQNSFFNANLMSITSDWALETLPSGKAKFIEKKPSIKTLPKRRHDKEKPSYFKSEQFLVELGVLDSKGKVKKDKGDKFKQINKFVEIVGSQISKSSLSSKAKIQIHDMGAGKGYLTFALYDHLANKNGLSVETTGVELRPELVKLCNDISEKLDFKGLKFGEGFISNYELVNTDILIALHACDTATDDAIYKGIQSGAELIICSPCCHKQVRKSMEVQSKHADILGHGILLERQAEIVTDTLRALLMEANGYKTKIFEFVSTEHSGKNLMIVGQKRSGFNNGEERMEAYRKLKREFGVQNHYLEDLLNSK
jgi:hypothetical protein